MIEHLRIARPVTDVARSATMCCAGLRLEVIGKLENHAGVDGVMVGRAGGACHLEFTHSMVHKVRPTPTPVAAPIQCGQPSL